MQEPFLVTIFLCINVYKKYIFYISINGLDFFHFKIKENLPMLSFQIPTAVISGHKTISLKCQLF